MLSVIYDLHSRVKISTVSYHQRELFWYVVPHTKEKIVFYNIHEHSNILKQQYINALYKFIILILQVYYTEILDLVALSINHWLFSHDISAVAEV